MADPDNIDTPGEILVPTIAGCPFLNVKEEKKTSVLKRGSSMRYCYETGC